MRSQDEELEQMRAGVSCAVLLERLPPPWRLDKKESTRRCLKYRRGAGEVLLITHRGSWVVGSWQHRQGRHLQPGEVFWIRV